MKMIVEFAQSLDFSKQGLWNNARSNSIRHAKLIDYCSGLLQTTGRNSVEPMAATLAPDDVRSLHQSLHHFVADSN